MSKRKLMTLVIAGLLVLAGGFYPLYADIVRDGETLELASGETFGLELPRFEAPAGGLNFELSAEFPKVDRTVVYRVKVPDVTVDSVIEMGRKLGFEGDAGSIDSGAKIAMLDENGGDIRQLAVWVNCGTVEYAVLGEVDKLYPPYPPTLPSDDEAKEIAIDFLTQGGLFPDGAQFVEVIPGGTCGGVHGEYVTHLLVCFARDIDGTPITGLGAKFGVRIGDKGEVVALYRVWREVEPYKAVSVKAPADAYQELVAGNASYVAPLECEDVVIESISLAYWMDAAHEIQEYVVPVYQFKGKCLDKEGQYLEDFVAWCEATR